MCERIVADLGLHGNQIKHKLISSRRSGIHLLEFPLLVAEVVQLAAGADVGDVLPKGEGGAPRGAEGAGGRQVGGRRAAVRPLSLQPLLLGARLLPLLPLDLPVDGHVAVLLVQNRWRVDGRQQQRWSGDER